MGPNNDIGIAVTIGAEARIGVGNEIAACGFHGRRGWTEVETVIGPRAVIGSSCRIEIEASREERTAAEETDDGTAARITAVGAGVEIGDGTVLTGATRALGRR